MSTSNQVEGQIEKKFPDSKDILALRKKHLDFYFRVDGELDKLIRKLVHGGSVSCAIHFEDWDLEDDFIARLRKMGYNAKANWVVNHKGKKCPKNGVGRWKSYCNCAKNSLELTISLACDQNTSCCF